MATREDKEEKMEYFLQLFGDHSISWAVAVIGALIFLYLCYKKVESYFSDKAIREKNKDERIQDVIDQAKKYPAWHQQSVEIQQKFTDAIDGLRDSQKETIERIRSLEEEMQRRERNKLRDRILRSYRYYTSIEKNPSKAWSEMEAEAFWKIFKDYEELKGNGYVHTEVQPAMNELEVIPMHETARITELMQGRK